MARFRVGDRVKLRENWLEEVERSNINLNSYWVQQLIAERPPTEEGYLVTDSDIPTSIRVDDFLWVSPTAFELV